MPFSLDQVVPWGRLFDEYRRMFDLGDSELQRPILGCADGPASFNAELTIRGGSVVSCDPLYRFSVRDIQLRIDESLNEVLRQTRENASQFLWSDGIPDVESLGRLRRCAMDQFLADFPEGKDAGRYVAGELPTLPFSTDRFELALCSHFLFLYDSLGYEFHIRSVLELLRVAAEVRVFPLVQLDGERSPFVPRVIDELARHGYTSELVRVPYEFQRGASEILRVRRDEVR